MKAVGGVVVRHAFVTASLLLGIARMTVVGSARRVGGASADGRAMRPTRA